MLLNNGELIYDDRTARTFLQSVGVEDADTFLSIAGNTDVLTTELKYYQQESNDYERIIDEYDSNIQTFICELEEMCDKLASGTGGTKKQYADRIMALVREHFYY